MVHQLDAVKFDSALHTHDVDNKQGSLYSANSLTPQLVSQVAHTLGGDAGKFAAVTGCAVVGLIGDSYMWWTICDRQIESTRSRVNGGEYFSEREYPYVLDLSQVSVRLGSAQRKVSSDRKDLMSLLFFPKRNSNHSDLSNGRAA
ncbi:hypothetical protein SARC_10758 [Sphaeroforma arctica JP610]|uniref:Uncharacterized protein n=1 Tax=Sphaeroforma arctica JP610 TaxID=667725 RepID=A0A0L0FJ03_9EUKA|nr:hypothetical protein SARC_10758 [Sphaeroforma arctica JP610]KNC76759.1 hypothetical protein SARC_10758 [Sphaeroforma arctica JP610]|eukprot:XP_014150661.1 hypothetical protein SARC_10758 [Sphaeroforma arctica JP610]